ncbi:O-Glycosyl hydrolases family 17 protein [Hibiscus syriacus]|uniref:O-Glycosyl hydrolases family 17 protein n=1 Tax=Hibiscus syriacus TaxID=106335 RepID=A0A6A3ADL0_HIBSY|nr:O-Glycosyl hydrolases family 17 protein [Hibiscus syriacus]
MLVEVVITFGIKLLELEGMVVDGNDWRRIRGAPILKTSLAAPTSQMPGSSSLEHVEDTASQDSNSDMAKTPPSKRSVWRSTPSVLPDSISAQSVLESTASTNPSSPVNLSNSTKEEDITNFLGRLGVVPSAPDMSKRNILGVDERHGNSSMGQSLASPISNRMILPQAAKANDVSSSADSSNPIESAGLPGRAFSPSVVSGMQWRPGSSFQNKNELGQFRERTDIAPDIREKFLQRFQQLNSQSSSFSIQSGVGLSGQTPGLNSVISSSLQQQPTSIHQQSSQQALVMNVPKDAGSEAIPTSGLSKNLMNEDDSKAPYAIDSPAAVSGSLTEPARNIRDIDLSPGQPLQYNQSSSGLGVIGRRSVSDLGAIGDNLSEDSGCVVSYGECKDPPVAKKKVNGGSSINRQQPLNGSLSDNRRNQAASDFRSENYPGGELGGARVKSRSIKDKLKRSHLQASSTNKDTSSAQNAAVVVHDGIKELPKKGCCDEKLGEVARNGKIGLNNWWKTSTSVHRKSEMEGVSRKNHCEVEGVMDEDKLHVLGKCLVGWCKNFIKIGHLARQMQAKGLTGFSLMRAAGNAVLMIFEDSSSLRSVKNDKSETPAKWFSRVEVWSETLVVECRRVGDNSFKIIVHEIETSFKPNSWAPDEVESH